MSRRSFRSLRRFLNLWRSILSISFHSRRACARRRRQDVPGFGNAQNRRLAGCDGLPRPEHPLGWLDPQQAAWLARQRGADRLDPVHVGPADSACGRGDADALSGDAILLPHGGRASAMGSLFAWYVVFGGGDLDRRRRRRGPSRQRVAVRGSGGRSCRNRFEWVGAAVQGRLAALVGAGARRRRFSTLVSGRVARVAGPGRGLGRRVLLALGLATPLLCGALAVACAWASMSMGASLYYTTLLFLSLAFSGAGGWSLDAGLRRFLERSTIRPGKRPRP